MEAAFCRLKDFRQIATRYDKLARNFLSAVILATIVAFWTRLSLSPSPSGIYTRDTVELFSSEGISSSTYLCSNINDLKRRAKKIIL